MPGRSLYGSSIDDPSPAICRRPARIFSPRTYEIAVSARIFSPRTYEIAVCMPSFRDEGKGMVERWYAIGVHADGMVASDQERPIKPFWKGKLSSCSSFAALGSILYRFGPSSDVFKRRVNSPTADDWIPVPSMNTPRRRPDKFVLGSKLYVLGSDSPSNTIYAEVFDPVINRWEALPDPPYKMEYEKISAALENPNRILVASLVLDEDDYDSISSAIFFVYDVGHGSWKVLEPAQRKLHPQCPLGSRGRAVAVANFLYWITDEFQLLCYDLDSDLWLLGHLDGLLIPSAEPHLPGLVHLENHRFCVLQCPIGDDHRCHYVQCYIFDVTHNPEEESLGVSVVWAHKYTTENPSTITQCFLLGQ